MATVILCDICTEPAGLRAVKVDVPRPPHPHTNESIGRETIDVCVSCLSWVNGLRAEKTVEEIRRVSGVSGGE